MTSSKYRKKSDIIKRKPRFLWTDDVIEEFADRLLLWAELHTSCYLESFCAQEKTYPQKLSELAQKNDKMAESLKSAKAACASHIAEATAAGEMPPAFGIFALKNVGRWTDRHEVEHTGEVTHRVRIVELPKKGSEAVITEGVTPLLPGPAPLLFGSDGQK